MPIGEATSFCIRPGGRMNTSSNISPGCVGGRFVGGSMAVRCWLSGRRNLGTFRTGVIPHKAHPVLIVDAARVLAGPVPFQGLQPDLRRGHQALRRTAWFYRSSFRRAIIDRDAGSVFRADLESTPLKMSSLPISRTIESPNLATHLRAEHIAAPLSSGKGTGIQRHSRGTMAEQKTRNGPLFCVGRTCGSVRRNAGPFHLMF